MYVHEAKQFRREWAANVNLPGEHSQVQPETTVTRYSTGNYVWSLWEIDA